VKAISNLLWGECWCIGIARDLIRSSKLYQRQRAVLEAVVYFATAVSYMHTKPETLPMRIQMACRIFWKLCGIFSGTSQVRLDFLTFLNAVHFIRENRLAAYKFQLHIYILDLLVLAAIRYATRGSLMEIDFFQSF